MRLLHLFSFFSIFFSSFLIEASENFSRLEIVSEGRISVPSDLVEISLEVISERKEVADALLISNEKMAKIIDSLHLLGIEKSEYQTTNFSIQPIYTKAPKDTPPDWIPKIEAYRVNTLLHVKTQKISLIGQVVDSAIKAGANSLHSLSFGIGNEKSHQDSLIKNASTQALKKAASLAKEFKQRLVKVREIAMVNTPTVPSYKRMMTGSFSGGNSSFESGNIDLQTEVRVVFEIEPIVEEEDKK